jgi:predicted ABC-type ATPase
MHGIFTNEGTMHGVSKGAKLRGPATLPGYRNVTRGHADIEPHLGSSAKGLLWDVPAKDMHAFDEIEGTSHDFYERIAVRPTHTESGETTHAEAYRQTPGHRSRYAPSENPLHGITDRMSALPVPVKSAKESAKTFEATPSAPPPRTNLARSVLGDAADTKEKYTIAVPGAGRVYTPEREQLHNQIVARFLDGHSKSSGQPQALFTAGGPGSGKSAMLKAPGANIPADAVEVNPDLVKAMLPEFERLSAARDPESGSALHEESSQIARRIADEARARGLNVVMDGVGDSGTGKFVDKMQKLHAAGYDVHVAVAALPASKGWERVQTRAKSSGRAVPAAIVAEMYDLVPKRFLEYAKEPWLHVNLWSTDVNRGEAARLIARKSAGSTNLRVAMPAEYAAFVGS